MSTPFFDAPKLNLIVVAIPFMSFMISNGLLIAQIVVDAKLLTTSPDPADALCGVRTYSILSISCSAFSVLCLLACCAVYPCLVLERRTPWTGFIAVSISLCFINLVPTIFKIVDLPTSSTTCPSLYPRIMVSLILSAVTLFVLHISVSAMVLARRIGGVEGAADEARLVRGAVAPPPGLPYWKGPAGEYSSEGSQSAA